MSPVLITGGAGFIGTNLAARLLSQSRPVILLDNLSRPGVETNFRWLRSRFGHQVQLERADVRDMCALQRLVPRASAVFHFAGQTAVTSSLEDPDLDFEVNARGTLNLLEALRRSPTRPPLVFTSTNKVYGGLEDVALEHSTLRYEPADQALRQAGISEERALAFHSPYGCSKGTADQYVLEYARSFGLRALVFRMSCIYGPHQCGTEDQGWVAHFMLRALARAPICVYGDGRQVRDLLYVDDLVDAFLLALEHADRLSGQAFNVGGGQTRAASLLEVLDIIRALNGSCEVTYADWRASDQRYYVSNTDKLRAATGWTPRTGVAAGLEALYAWFVAQESSSPRTRPIAPAVRAGDNLPANLNGARGHAS